MQVSKQVGYLCSALTFNELGVLVGREVEMFELVPKVRQRQGIVVETDRKSVHLKARCW